MSTGKVTTIGGGGSSGNEIFDETLLCSMLGVETWQSYRAGINPVMLLDLHLVQPDADTMANALSAGMAAIVKLALAGDTYGNPARLAAFINGQMSLAAPEDQQRWAAQGRLGYLEMYTVLNLHPDHPDAVAVTKLVSVLVASVYAGVRWQEPYENTLKMIWFAICDTAITAAGKAPA